MSPRPALLAPPPTTTSPSRRQTLLPGLLVVATVAGLLGCSPLASAPGATGAPPVASSQRVREPTATPAAKAADADEPTGAGDPIGASDGEVPAGVTVFDDEYAAVAKLDPALRKALRSAAKAARRAGVTFGVNSGWRSPAYQARLFDEAVATYGSRARAARWVATPDTSPHVSGDAVDVSAAAAKWVAAHGARFGLCRIYRNEPWHVELRPEAVARGCPAEYADPSADPRMQR